LDNKKNDQMLCFFGLDNNKTLVFLCILDNKGVFFWTTIGQQFFFCEKIGPRRLETIQGPRMLMNAFGTLWKPLRVSWGL